ncbi:MAG: hypothetical protein V1818_02000 [Candidatus Aenigmatarchaeota archaeon]
MVNFFEERYKKESSFLEEPSKAVSDIITAFTEDNPYKKIPYLFKGELLSMYTDWKILEYEEKMIGPESHGKNGKPHFHAIVYLIAKKSA